MRRTGADHVYAFGFLIAVTIFHNASKELVHFQQYVSLETAMQQFSTENWASWYAINLQNKAAAYDFVYDCSTRLRVACTTAARGKSLRNRTYTATQMPFFDIYVKAGAIPTPPTTTYKSRQ